MQSSDKCQISSTVTKEIVQCWQSETNHLGEWERFNVRETEIAGPLTISPLRNTFLKDETVDGRKWRKVMNCAIEAPC